jgi:hypothetical protein
MDGTRFDALARSLAGGTSRRGLLGGLAALAAGAAAAGPTAAACPPGQVSKRGKCLCRLTGRPPANDVCPCPAGQVDTGDGLGCLGCRSVADCPLDDPCRPPECLAGTCATKTVAEGQQGACDAGEVCCGGACTFIGSDANCQACGDSCAAGTERCDPDTGCVTCYQVGETLPGGICGIDTVGLCCNGRCSGSICCSDEGGTCANDSWCCALSGLMCYAGTCVTCLPTGAPLTGGCNIDTVGLCCNGRCSGSICCSDEGESCANDGECCALSGLTCVSGTCRQA